MRKLILLAPLALMAACSQSEPAPEPTEEAPPAETAVLAIDGMPLTGTYEVTSADGATVLRETVNADGTVVVVEGDETTNGTWTSTGPDNYCITYEGDAEPTCYAETLSEDGVWSAVNVQDPEEVWTVKRVG